MARRDHPNPRGVHDRTQPVLLPPYSYASPTNDQLPLLEVAALSSDTPIVLGPVGANWATVGAGHTARDAIALLKDAGILAVVAPADTLAEHAGPPAAAARRDVADRGLLELCDVQARSTGKQRWTLSLARPP